MSRTITKVATVDVGSAAGGRFERSDDAFRTRFTEPVRMLSFMLAGNAYFTVVPASGARITYRIALAQVRPTDPPNKARPWFVSVLTGPDNTRSYTYLGLIRGAGARFEDYTRGVKSAIGEDAPSARLFAWLWAQLHGGTHLHQAEVWTEGRCGRCGRRLTVPESVELGIGPECATKGGA